MRLVRACVLATVTLLFSSALSTQQALAFTDVGKNHWAKEAITYVAETNTWMQDFGTEEFRPSARIIRNHFARALVLALAPGEPVDPSITFPDLPETSPFYPFANVAVKKGWMPKKGGEWRPTARVTMREADRALVLALGLRRAVTGLKNIREADGDRYAVNKWIPFLQLGRWLGLHYNHSKEEKDLQPATKMRRDEVAHALWKAATAPSWKLSRAVQLFQAVQLPALDPAAKVRHKHWRALTHFALNQMTNPYIWAGEWNARTPSWYCCGYQPQGGFDCSGFIWFVMKKYEQGYNAAQFRSYSGWSLPERNSAYMAKMAPKKIPWDRLKPGDLMFFSSSGGTKWDSVTHAGIYLGRGWMAHSRAGGPQLEWVGEGWYKDRFVWGRRVVTGG